MIYQKEFRQWEHKLAREFHRRFPHLSVWDFGDFMTRGMFDAGYTVDESLELWVHSSSEFLSGHKESRLKLDKSIRID